METGIHELTAGYALDALDADERTAYEAHLPGCERCQDELASFWQTTEALAVAASAAFPPFLGPVRLIIDPKDLAPTDGFEDLHREPFTSEVVLCDGGVYDNLGLETAWKRYRTILVSDGGGQMSAEPDPPNEWAGQSRRVLDLVDNQVRCLRKRQVVSSLRRGRRKGAYWGIRSDIAHYRLTDSLVCSYDATLKLAETATRLAAASTAGPRTLARVAASGSLSALSTRL